VRGMDRGRDTSHCRVGQVWKWFDPDIRCVVDSSILFGGRRPGHFKSQAEFYLRINGKEDLKKARGFEVGQASSRGVCVRNAGLYNPK